MRYGQTIPRVIVLTGASGLLGRSMTQALMRAGHRVVLVDANVEPLRPLVDAYGAESGGVALCPVDLTSDTAAETVERTALEAFGRIDMLVNNAAFTAFAAWPVADQAPKPWEVPTKLARKFFDINMLAQHALIAQMLPGMIERGWGRLINITCSYYNMQRLYPYGATKAALEALTAAIELDLKGTGVTANTLNPGGAVRTPELVAANPDLVWWVGADVMNAALLFLASPLSDGIEGRRYIGSRFAGAAPWYTAIEQGSGSLEWYGFGTVPGTQ